MLTGDFVEDYEAMVPLQMLLMVNETFSNGFMDGKWATAPSLPAYPAWIRSFLKVPDTGTAP